MDQYIQRFSKYLKKVQIIASLDKLNKREGRSRLGSRTWIGSR